LNSQHELKLGLHDCHVNSVVVSRNCKYVASGSGDRTVILWDLESRNKLAQLAHHAYVL